jgi:hypothetical protein
MAAPAREIRSAAAHRSARVDAVVTAVALRQ